MDSFIFDKVSFRLESKNNFAISGGGLFLDELVECLSSRYICFSV